MEVNNNLAFSNSMQKPEVSDKTTDTTKAKSVTNAAVQKNENASVSSTSSVADVKEIQEAVEKLSEFVSIVSNRGLQISVDNDLSQIVLTVVNSESQETIRQIPTEEVMDLMKRMRDLSEEFFGDSKGLLVERKA